MTVGRRILQLRHERDLSRGQLAYLTGLDETALFRLERGARLPRYPTLLKLATGFKLTLSELLEGVDR